MKTKLVFLILAAALVVSPAFPASEAKKTTPPATKEKAATEASFWITTSSGVRHNSKCRYFKNSKGRPGTKDEGRACKICGG